MRVCECQSLCLFVSNMFELNLVRDVYCVSLANSCVTGFWVYYYIHSVLPFHCIYVLCAAEENNNKTFNRKKTVLFFVPVLLSLPGKQVSPRLEAPTAVQTKLKNAEWKKLQGQSHPQEIASVSKTY